MTDIEKLRQEMLDFQEARNKNNLISLPDIRLDNTQWQLVRDLAGIKCNIQYISIVLRIKSLLNTHEWNLVKRMCFKFPSNECYILPNSVDIIWMGIK